MQGDIDLFAGPGGLDLAARDLGRRVLGIELDPDAVETRRRAGLRTLQADVALLRPQQVYAAEYAAEQLPMGGLLGSPPCPLFSSNGNRQGLRRLDVLVACIYELLDGIDTRAQALVHLADDLEPSMPRDDQAELVFDSMPTSARAKAEAVAREALLVVEPARWAHDLLPEWIVLEQVPAVLPLWEVMADALGGHGYSAATGIVDASDFSVPQARERAVLVASRAREAKIPEPDYFPHLTMADVLCWPDAEGEVNTGRDWKPGGTRADAQTVDVGTRPAPTFTTKSLSQWHVRPGKDGPSRGLTVEEALVVQGFPRDYPVAGGREAAGRQIGNAVPPALARAVIGQVLDDPSDS